MADPKTYRPSSGDIPTQPGVYRFSDRHGRIIYVGKAKNLRSRLSSYFADPATLADRTRRMVFTAAAVEWTVVRHEVEALQLEYAWIKEFDPRFNVKYRDDKSYPWLAVTLQEKFPRVQVMRGEKKPGVRYFGPYTHAWAIRETVDLLLRTFPIRTCKKGEFNRAEQSGRPCLLAHIEKCSAPCVGKVTAEQHRSLAEDFCDFMDGHTTKFADKLRAEMLSASDDLDFERAARLRDDVAALERVIAKSVVVLPDSTDADVFGLESDELEAAVQVFHVRGGRVRGQRGWVTEKVEPVSDEELVATLVTQVYGAADPSAIPREVLVPYLPTNSADLQEWLSHRRGSQVALRIPQRGDKKELQATVLTNAKQALALHRTKRAGDLTTRSAALEQLTEALDLAEVPLRIECYDISHLAGTHVVASMVVFEDGAARKSEYRRFEIRQVKGNDDVAAMHEVITRRFRRYLAERDRINSTAEVHSRTSPENSGFRYPPSLVVVDGARPQAQAAQLALTELGITDVAVCGLAKRLEEVWLPDDEFPVVLPRTSEGLYLLQRVRDEAHRFAIAYHRSKRSKAMVVGVLDGVPGLGPQRSKAIFDHFGSVRALREATVEGLQEVKGVGPALAATVIDHLAAESGQSEAINVTTGEVLD